MTQLTTNPYAPPEAAVEVVPPDVDQEIWREGKLVVCHRNAHLPDRCVVCNEPAEGHGLVRKMAWHSPWLFLLILVNLLIYLIVALCVHKKAKIRISLCPRHQARRRLGLWIGWLGLLVSLAALTSPAFVEYAHGDPLRNYVPLTGLCGLIVFPIIAALMTMMVTPRRINHDHAWLRVGKAFAYSFPERG